MGDYRATETVRVKVVRGGAEVPASVGLGEFTYGREGKTVTMFGYVDDHDPDRITHMSFRLDYFRPAEVVEHAKTKGGGWFWFDTGTTGTELKISARELEVALYRLGLLNTIGDTET